MTSSSIVIPTLDPGNEYLTRYLGRLDAFDVHVQHDRDRDGFARTCNLGAKETDGDVLVFLNDDTVPQAGWHEALVDRVDDGTICGAHLIYPDGSTQHSGVMLRRDRLGRLEAYNRRTPSPSGEVPAVTGACLAVTRSTWEALGGFDEGYRNGYEDVDLCLRHRQAGGTVRYVAESVVVHFESRSPGRFDHKDRNIALLQDRWGDLPI